MLPNFFSARVSAKSAMGFGSGFFLCPTPPTVNKLFMVDVNKSLDRLLTPCLQSRPMTPKESSRLIAAAGGDHEFATLLGIADRKNYRQRVNNWKRRGIPSDVF